VVVAQAKSAILVPFREVEDIVEEWRRELDPSHTRGIPAHVTVLFPFTQQAELTNKILNDLGNFFSKIPLFDVCFDSTAWFEGRVVYLVPKPEERFRVMTQQLLQAFPTCRPYGGKFADVIPHLTLGDGAPIERLQEAESAVLKSLPIQTQAVEAWLMTGGMEPDSWSVRESFPMGK
jgi:2'-5' RNA ligase